MISSTLVSLMDMVSHAYVIHHCKKIRLLPYDFVRIVGFTVCAQYAVPMLCSCEGGFATSDWLEQNLESFIEASWQDGNAAAMAISDAFVEVLCSSTCAPFFILCSSSFSFAEEVLHIMSLR